MRNKHGEFTWYELLTPDADAAQRFYGDVVGWTASDSGQPGVDYRLLDAGGTQIGGMLQISDEMQAQGVRPGWLGYIGVDDVDASVDSIVKAGGSVHMPPWSIPEVGRLAMLSDPQGAVFYVMRGASDEPSLAFASEVPKPGHCAWNELATRDPSGALAFYTHQFGWTKDGEMDMGEHGKYEFLRHGFLLGALMQKPAALPSSTWSFYFRVPDIDAAATKIRAGGGQITQEPHEIPGGELILHGIDPQGGPFALVGPRV